MTRHTETGGTLSSGTRSGSTLSGSTLSGSRASDKRGSQRATNSDFGRLDAARLGVVVIASMASVAGFKAVFVDWDFMFAAVLGAIGAGSVVALSWWRRLLVGETLALSSVGLVLLGGVAAGPLPTPDAFAALFRGLLSGWADLLSLTPPFDDTPELRALPFVLAWIAATLGGELLHRTSQPTLPALGPLVGLAISVLVTAENRSIAVAQGIVIAIGALVVGRSEHLVAPKTRPAPQRHRATRVARVAIACLLVGIAAPFLGPRLPFADAHERFDLRDRRVPPWDPLATPSPLVELKGQLQEGVRDEVVFTVAADVPITRWNLAVLGDFDGVVWTVGSAAGAEARSEFRPVGSDLADRPNEITVSAERVEATITIGDLGGAWVPTAGWADSALFTHASDPVEPGVPAADEPSATDLQDRLRMNVVTGTLAVPSGVQSGMTYDLVADIVPEPSDTEAAEFELAPVDERRDLETIPPSIRNLAADFTEGTDRDWSRAQAIRDRFVADGFYDVSPAARPGHSYFRLAEFLDDPDRLVGYEEQYAAAAATIAEIAELPARVVVGYVIPVDRYDNGVAEVVASDISAWIEVDAGPQGWVPLDVSPDRSREPTNEATGVSVEDVAVPNPPPPPQIPPSPEVFADEEVDDDEEEEEAEEEEADEVLPAQSGWSAPAIAGVTAGSLVLVLLAFAALIAGWKVWRRRRRRHEADAARCVALAWRETLDRYSEAGVAVPARVTPSEAVRSFEHHGGLDAERAAELRHLVGIVQRSAFHAQAPEPDDAAEAWQHYDRVVDTFKSNHSGFQRLLMAVSPRTLRSSGWSNTSARPSNRTSRPDTTPIIDDARHEKVSP